VGERRTCLLRRTSGAKVHGAIGDWLLDGCATYNVMHPYDDGIALDEYVDWLINAGYPIQRIPDHDGWLQRFETSLRALPEGQRQHTLLPLLNKYQRPEKPVRGP